MKLSELIAVSPCPEMVYGVAVDTESFSPPQGLRSIGVLADLDDGDFGDVLLDVIIAYRLAGIEVILEIPAEAHLTDPEYLMSVAVNAGFSLSLLPPQTDDATDREAYTQRLLQFTALFLNNANFSGSLLPVTSYQEYMFRELISDVSNFQANDPYMWAVFAERVDEEFSDAFKAAMRARILEHFGGEAGFRQFGMSLFRSVASRVRQNASDLFAQAQTCSGETESLATPC